MRDLFERLSRSVPGLRAAWGRRHQGQGVREGVESQAHVQYQGEGSPLHRRS